MVSSAPEGWYVDPSTGTNLRFWNGATWTEEVAPLPYKRTHSGPVAQLGPAEPTVTAPEPEAASTDAPQSAPQDAGESTDLDPDIERTRLSRREQRARRGTDDQSDDDSPTHLPPMTPPHAVAIAEEAEPVEEVEIPAAPNPPVSGHYPQRSQSARRGRIVVLYVLLFVLAVATGVAARLAGVL